MARQDKAARPRQAPRRRHLGPAAWTGRYLPPVADWLRSFLESPTTRSGQRCPADCVLKHKLLWHTYGLLGVAQQQQQFASELQVLHARDKESAHEPHPRAC